MKEPRVDRRELNRRGFVKASLVPAALAVQASRPGRSTEPHPEEMPDAQGIIDTNVHLFSWPGRRLKYDQTEALVGKLRQHRIEKAWAGTFDALLHKQLDAANHRLTEECSSRGGGLLVPIGSVNPAWPDWEEDLRRCQEEYRMPGIRLYPAYHGYTPSHPGFLKLLNSAAARGLLVQVCIRVEDERVHHPSLLAPVVDAATLAAALGQVPQARVQLLNADTIFRSGHAAALVDQTNTTFDIAAVEGNGGLARLIGGGHPTYRGQVPVDRLLFGSHAPFFPCEAALLKLFESPLDRRQLEAIMRTNARQLLG